MNTTDRSVIHFWNKLRWHFPKAFGIESNQKEKYVLEYIHTSMKFR